MDILVSKYVILFLDKDSPVKAIVRGSERLVISSTADVELELEEQELDAEFEALLKQLQERLTGYGLYTLAVITENVNGSGETVQREHEVLDVRLPDDDVREAAEEFVRRNFENTMNNRAWLKSVIRTRAATA